MKNKTLLMTLFTGMLALASLHTFAQTTQAGQESKTEKQEAKALDDKQRLDNATDLRKDTRADARVAKANAKEARRDAAKQAKRAARMESKAQRNRADADKQAKKAAKATKKSASN